MLRRGNRRIGGRVPVARKGHRLASEQERHDDESEESTADRLEDWRAAEREVSRQEPGSILGRLARKAADRAREVFHLREGEARHVEAQRRAGHPNEPQDRR